MILLDGKKHAAEVRGKVKREIDKLRPIYGRAPHLAVILVGDDPASQVYVRNKERACEETGIVSRVWRLPADTTTQDKLEDVILELNDSDDIDGILLQMPIPDHLDALACQSLIDPAKDVDGFHPENMGRLVLGMPGLRPCTPNGVMHLLERYSLTPCGKKAVVIGRSNIVGKPMAMMLSQPNLLSNATVTLCHSRTPDVAKECREADFIIAAIGKPKFVTRDMVKPGAVVIDVGINRADEGLIGDVDFENVKDIVHAITPVPGGVGPMTIAMLMSNTLQAYTWRMEDLEAEEAE